MVKETQINNVSLLMSDGQWRTLEDIKAALGGRGSLRSIGSTLRDLRKPKRGGYLVERQLLRIVGTVQVYKYRVSPSVTLSNRDYI